MTHRTVIRLFSTTLIAALALGCGGDTPTGSVSNGLLEVDPLYAGVKQGSTQQLSATINGEDASVTWASTDQTIATVSPSGLVTGVALGQASITATMVSDPTQKRSASITVVKASSAPPAASVAP
jgi:uncharacterized protein YjdB